MLPAKLVRSHRTVGPYSAQRGWAAWCDRGAVIQRHSGQPVAVAIRQALIAARDRDVCRATASTGSCHPRSPAPSRQ
jgi:hypothetical protein